MTVKLYSVQISDHLGSNEGNVYVGHGGHGDFMVGQPEPADVMKAAVNVRNMLCVIPLWSNPSHALHVIH